ncbi:GNAT family N-acetyltransferase [Nibricoccus sp. IMCC34717]|uniref:GNAT family N-acetyltransferase n=1 Tax=Nibricoccus sp. IMCC34717 TaxID=3034021 RepID=UPI00384CE997
MPDLLVPLAPLPLDWGFVAEQQKLGITIRKPIGPEHEAVVRFVRENFPGSLGWPAEAARSLQLSPVSCWVAVENGKLLGFASYDATALGIFGPTGVTEAARGRGTGKALLLACLLDMRLKGYAYAVIGWAGPVDFYRKAVGAIVIPDQTDPPGIYRGMVQP